MYIKKELAEGFEVKIEVDDHNIYDTCQHCGEEYEVDLFDFVLTALEQDAADEMPPDMCCDRCWNKYKKSIDRYKALKERKAEVLAIKKAGTK